MVLTFKTPTRMSLLDVTSMGDSSKRGDTTTIGQFDSGLKYAIALLLRNNVDIRIKTDEDEFSFSTNSHSYGDGKEKELITVYSLNHGEIMTGFAKNLGYNWELYMAFRELYSNMLDEGGVYYEENREFDGKGTEIYLSFDEENPFYEIYQNRHLYVADFYSNVSKEIISVVSETEGFKTFNWLNTAILKEPSVELIGKKFSPNTIYRESVTLESVPIKEEDILIEKELSFKEQVLKSYKLDIGDIEIKRVKLKGNKAVSDKYNKCIIVDEDFIMEEDFHLFLIEYYVYLHGSDKVIKVLAKELTNKMK